MPYIGVSPQFGVRRKHTYTATTGQTSFSGAGAEGTSLSYKDSNFVDVYQNGVKLGDADYTSTSGTAIVLAQGASVDDLVEIIVFDAFSAADTVSKADGGTFDGNVTMAGTLDVTGNGTVGGTLAVTGETTLATHLNMGDNDKIKLGASGDLEIYHDTNHSYIEDTGTGELRLKSDGTAIRFQHGSETMSLYTADGAVELYNDDSKKFETTSEGINVIGDEKQHKKGDGTSSNREIKAFFSVSTGTSNTTIFTVDTGSQHSGYYYEVICYAGDWSGHSSARVIKRGFINGYDGYTGHDSIESDGPYASNIIENISWNGTSGETTYQLRLDTGSVVLTGMVRIVGTISGFTITN
jgi:hypothetical protein